eukprot:GHVR01155136.1.p1 GENE.GHVR01155136.1~~GHVR01155136.1.p1  ORF type:complete len:115 (+),score=0.26 GHVR01155136.1:721-1065(+)
MREKFKEQIKTDSRFFKKNNILDYSLMLVEVSVPSNVPVANRQGKNIFKSHFGGIKGRKPNQLYILIIIDILTAFETRKNIEYLFKSTFLSKDVSCIPPTEYCKRFREFMWNAV